VQMMEMNARRALHFVFKVGNRTDTIKFYRDILGIKVLLTDCHANKLITVKNRCFATKSLLKDAKQLVMG